MDDSYQPGRFYIDMNLIDENPDLVARVFASMRAVVLAVEVELVNKIVEYTCVSPLFNSVPAGEEIPMYNIVISDNDDND